LTTDGSIAGNERAQFTGKQQEADSIKIRLRNFCINYIYILIISTAGKLCKILRMATGTTDNLQFLDTARRPTLDLIRVPQR
jgi:hypothetical protein